MNNSYLDSRQPTAQRLLTNENHDTTTAIGKFGNPCIIRFPGWSRMPERIFQR